MIKAIALSNHIISLFEEKNCKITNLKLQKVLYYVQGYFFKEFDKEAFPEEIHGWQYGPVVPMVYYEYSIYGSAPLSSSSEIKSDLCPREQSLVKKIVDKCSSISSSKLVDMTHSETPWKTTSMGSIINKKNIKSFFDNNNPLNI